MLKELLLFLFSIIGFAISFHIWNTSVRKKKKLVCGIGDGDCDRVVKSKYSKTFGFNNSVLGMLYYLFILTVGISMLLIPAFLGASYIRYTLIAITGSSVIFSAYLFLIEVAVIKKICEYCTISGIVSVLIFITIVF